jgi:hypothetical protein
MNFETLMSYIDYVIEGHLANQLIGILNIVLVKTNEFLINNFFILWAFAVFFQKFAERTSFKWDDYWSGKLIKFLTRIKPAKLSSPEERFRRDKNKEI